ncbi:MAG: polysaccharide deacetylase family protein, partial [Anaerolineales bacterium]
TQARPTRQATASLPTEDPLPTASEPSASRTARPRRMFGPGEVEIPILLYHHVDAVAGGRRYTISADLLRDQMQILADGGYETVTISEVAAAIRSGSELPARPIVVTFDDGNEDTYAEAFPILSSYGFRGVVFAVGNRTGAKGFMTADELLALVEAGWEIGSHGWSHVDLTTLGATQWRQEILGSKLELERVLGAPVRAFAYPFGSATRAIIAKVAEYGYALGAGLGSANHHDRGSVYYLGRREIYGYWTLEQFRTVLESSEQ